jgi:enamine deaminase RidA (YjgF/YER057c/UK114 family)
MAVLRLDRDGNSRPDGEPTMTDRPSPSPSRRRFLAQAGLFAAGAAAGAAWALFGRLTPAAFAQQNSSGGAEARLRRLGIELPATTPARNTYVPTVQVGQLLFVAGHGPGVVRGEPIVGKVGRDLDLQAAQRAARRAGLRILAAVREALGSLDKVQRVVKTLGMVNCTADFAQQPAVVNGCSDLMVEVFGDEAGKGARSAVGMGSLPGGIPIEVEMIFQVRS